MSEEQENKWREEFEELNTLQFDNLSQYEREEKIYLAACKKRQEEIQEEIEELKSLIKQATPFVTCVKEITELPEYRQAIATKVLTEWLEKAEKIK